MSGKYRIIRLWHPICPRNQLNDFAFVGADACKIAFTLSGSTTIPSLLTMWPNNAPLVTPNAHFVEFKLNLAFRHFSRHIRRWSKCSVFRLYPVNSSRKTYMNVGMYSPNIFIMILWNIVDVVFNPMNVVFSWSSRCIWIWLYPLKPSRKLYTSWPVTASNTPSVKGSGNTLVNVVAFSFR